jgi:NADPH-dependent 2,4-dienoyl-CoA reductase/sulfur reductase-like enzyme
MRGCAATRDVCSRRDPRGICIERPRRRRLSSMLHDMLVVGAGPAGILVWERLTAAGLDAVLLEAGAKPAGKVPLQGWANRSL